jgi:Domain of unknown function (DUF397)
VRVPTWDVPDELEFKTSTYSGGGGCVEVGQTPGGGPVVAVRHSRHHHLPPLLFTAAEWDAFVRGVKDGEFDVPAARPV